MNIQLDPPKVPPLTSSQRSRLRNRVMDKSMPGRDHSTRRWVAPMVAVAAVAALVASAALPAAAARPPVSLVASPSHLELRGGATNAVAVTNTGSQTAVVGVARSGFALDLRGRPRVTSRHARWIAVRPRRLTIAPGREGHWQFDLAGYVAARLRAAEVGTVDLTGLDTYADEARFFSYRRATHRGEPTYGRQFSLIGLPG